MWIARGKGTPRKSLPLLNTHLPAAPGVQNALPRPPGRTCQVTIVTDFPHSLQI